MASFKQLGTARHIDYDTAIEIESALSELEALTGSKYVRERTGKAVIEDHIDCTATHYECCGYVLREGNSPHKRCVIRYCPNCGAKVVS